MDPKALGSYSSNQRLRAVLEELDARDGDTGLQAVFGFGEGADLGRNALTGGFSEGRKTIDVPDVKTLVHTNSIQANCQKSRGVERDGLACPRHLQAKLNIRIRAIIYPQQIDEARPRTDGQQPRIRRRPVKGGERWEIVVSADLVMVETTMARMAGGFVELNDAMLQIDVDEAVYR